MTIKAHKLQSNITKITGGDSNLSLADLALIISTDVVNFKFKSTALGNGSNPDAPVFDSTSHLTLTSYQKALRDYNHHGESIRLDFMNDYAKSTIAFRDGRGANATAPKTKAWLVAHYEANGYDTRPIHKHFSIEVTDTTDNLQTRLEFPYDQDVCDVRFHESTVTNLLQSIQVASDDTSNAGFVLRRLSNDILTNQVDERYNGDNAIYTRWKMQFSDNAIAGDPALTGDNFTLSRWSDAGAYIDNVIKILRSNGNVGIGINTVADLLTHKLNVADTFQVRGNNNPTINVNRLSNTQFALVQFSTNNTANWTLRTRNNSTNDFELRNSLNFWSGFRMYDATRHMYQTAPNSVIADANLDNNTLSFYLDEATNNLRVKAKYSNGTVRIGTIALI